MSPFDRKPSERPPAPELRYWIAFVAAIAIGALAIGWLSVHQP
jgi:hypothetical protein